MIKDNVCFVNYLYLADPAYESFKHALSKTKVLSASFTWEKWGTFNNDILLNLLSHDLSMLFDTFPECEVSNIKSEINDDKCQVTFHADDIRVSIDIDRQCRIRNKSVTYETEDGLFMWTPGHFAHEDIEVSTNAANMLLDLQRDSFLSHVKHKDGFNNLKLSSKILSLIDSVRK